MGVVKDKLPTAIFALMVLFAIIGMAILLYIRTFTARTIRHVAVYLVIYQNSLLSFPVFIPTLKH
jgi:hypothetical protein